MAKTPKASTPKKADKPTRELSAEEIEQQAREELISKRKEHEAYMARQRKTVAFQRAKIAKIRVKKLRRKYPEFTALEMDNAKLKAENIKLKQQLNDAKAKS